MIGDTVFAVASPPGAAARGVLRVSGPTARECVEAVLADPGGVPAERAAIDTTVTVLGFSVACYLLSMPGPRSFTGEDVVELHLPGSPLLLARVGDALRAAGARDATPGEFTRRAFENGRLSLGQAEAVSDLIHAASRAEARWAVEVLRGGLDAGVADCRAAVQDGLALLETGLDFDEDDTGAVPRSQWQPLLERAAVLLQDLADGVPRGQAVGQVVVLGAANAGKSSLCNALAGRDAVLVADRAGTTRDVLAVEVAEGIALLDTPGDLADAEVSAVDRQALAHRDRLAGRSAAALVVVDSTRPALPRTELPVLAVVATKVDLQPELPSAVLAALPAATPVFAVDSVHGAGIEAVRDFLARTTAAGPCGGASRVADLLADAAGSVRAAAADGARGEAPELVACTLAEALTALDAISGRSSPEDLLDRIFGAFCLGK